jgi:hypothetical protein
VIKKIYTLFAISLLFGNALLANKRVVVDLGKQRAYCMDGNSVAMQSIISSGKNGYRTPNGTFYILEKSKKHNSSKYDNASMPNMMRLTNYGLAMHTGNVARPYASHGCVRMPKNFSEKVFRWADIGTPVTIYGGKANTIKRKVEKKILDKKNKYIVKQQNIKPKYFKNKDIATKIADTNSTNSTRVEYNYQSSNIK